MVVSLVVVVVDTSTVVASGGGVVPDVEPEAEPSGDI